MGTKQELLEQAEQEYDALKATIKDLDENQMCQVWLGQWGVREIIAHAAGWQQEMLVPLERPGREQAPYPDGTYDDFDSWNARFVEARNGRSASELLDELVASHRELLSVASRLPDDLFGDGKPASELVNGVAAAHHREHAAQIRQWRQG